LAPVEECSGSALEEQSYKPAQGLGWEPVKNKTSIL